MEGAQFSWVSVDVNIKYRRNYLLNQETPLGIVWSRAEPIYFMRFVGATSEMEEAMNEWMLDIHPATVEFEIK